LIEGRSFHQYDDVNKSIAWAGEIVNAPDFTALDGDLIKGLSLTRFPLGSDMKPGGG
jgi:hypothetical protein